MPLTETEVENRIIELESALDLHNHITSFSDGSGGNPIQSNALDSELKTEIETNISHRDVVDANPHQTKAHQIQITAGDYASHNIQQALDIIKSKSKNDYSELEELSNALANTIKTGDAVTDWTIEESSIKNNRALFNKIESHNHDSRYTKPFELENEINSHSESNAHDERYYTKNYLDSEFGTKSDKTHLHDAIYLRRPELDDLYFNVADDELNIDLEINKTSPKLTLNDESTNGKLVEITSTDERFLLKMNGNNKLDLQNDLVVDIPGNIILRDTPVSLEGHVHDNRYYQKYQVEDLLSTKSEQGHIHDHIYYRQSKVHSLLDEKTDLDHKHEDIYYNKTAADNRFVNNTVDTIDELTVNDKLNLNDRAYFDESGLIFKSYNSTISIDNDSDNNLGLNIRSGNLDQIYLNTDKVKVRSNLEVVGDIHLGHKINGVKIEDFKAEYDFHASKDDAHHEKYTDREARVAIYNDGNHYEMADHVHNHNTLYYKKEYINSALSQKADKDHDHDSMYMRIEEVIERLDNKSDKGHLHDTRYYTKDEMNQQITLIGDELQLKSDKGHDHNETYYTQAEVDQEIKDKTGNSAYVVSGEIITDINGRAKLPIPSGFDRHECHYMASAGQNTLVPYSSSGVEINRNTGDIQVSPSSVDAVNYMVIGIR
jgi:hypothetical protein